MAPSTDGASSANVTRRTLLIAGLTTAATALRGYTAATPAAGQVRAATIVPPKGVVFTTTGSTFSPLIELAATSSAAVSWLDETGAELAQGTAPTIDFGSSATRTVVMVTTFADVLTVNLGFDSTDDAGEYSLDNSYDKAPEFVSHVSGLTRLRKLRRFLADQTQLGGSLNVSGLAHLTHVECYHARVESINLKGCTSLVRLCLEENRLKKLDLNPVAATLRDLRSAAQESGKLEFTTLRKPLARLYHFCVRDQVIKGHPRAAQLPACQELWNWNCAQKGALPKPGVARSVRAAGNSYTSAKLSGRWKHEDDYGMLDLTDNRLTSVKLTGCRGLDTIWLGGNRLSSKEVDTVLAEVASWGTSGSELVLDGTNAAPSAAGRRSASTLTGRGWTVALASS